MLTLITLFAQGFRHALIVNLNFALHLTPGLSLSQTEHGWAHSSNTVYSVIQGLTGTSIEIQPCLGMSWYDLDSNVARVCTNKARTNSVKQGLSRFEHVCKRFSYDCCRVPSTVCYGLVWLNTTFTRLTWHLQGLHTVPQTFVRVMLELSHIRVWFDINWLQFWWIGFNREVIKNGRWQNKGIRNHDRIRQKKTKLINILLIYLS
jgi:hypothetical protein